MQHLKSTLILLLSLICFSCYHTNELNELPLSTIENPGRDAYQNNEKISKTYVLVHGAWHPESSWDMVRSELEKKGHTVVTMQLQGLGNDTTPPGTVLLNDHVDLVKDKITFIDDQVILVGHSYAGMVISQVAQDMPYKIKKLVYLSAFLPVNGEALADLSTQDPESVVGQNIIFDGQNGVARLPESVYIDAFYNTLNGRNANRKEVIAQVHKLIKELRPHPLPTFAMPVSLGPSFDETEKVYISCLKDRSVTLALQEKMMARYPDIKVIRMPYSDHSPFVTASKQLTAILAKQ